MPTVHRAVRATSAAAMMLASGQNLLVAAGLAGVLTASAALAVPQNPQVVAGSAGFSQNGSVMTITAANRTIINYSSFNVGRGETVRFVQPSANSAVLNRVLDLMPSRIDGSITSNGIVYLVNPAGIIFGNGSMVNAGQLIAAAGNISNSDFLTGRSAFTTSGGTVTNSGSLLGQTGVTLVGARVENFGTVVSPQGSVVMAAGERVLVGERQGRVFAEITPSAPANDQADLSTTAAAGSTTGGVSADGTTTGIGVDQQGTVTANRGRVLMGAGDMYATAIRTGRNSTTTGRAVEIAAPTRSGTGSNASGANGSRVELSGTISTAQTAAGQRGGDITVTGQHIALRDATVDASGSAGGGQIRIGGDYQGGGTLAKADTVIVDRGSVVKADAIDRGDGGTIVFWGSNGMLFGGSASANGGRLSGNGGLIETSGHTGLLLDPTSITASAAHGRAGIWLIDPFDITIDNTADTNIDFTDPTFSGNNSPAVLTVTSLLAQLENGVAVVVTTAGGGADAGNIVVAAPIVYTAAAAGSLTLTADNTIQISASITTTGGALDLTLNAPNAGITFDAVNIGLGAGTLTINAVGQTLVSDPSALITAGAVVVDLDSGVLRLGAGQTTVSGTATSSLSIFSAGTVTSGAGSITTPTLNITLNGTSGSIGLAASRLATNAATMNFANESGGTGDVFLSGIGATGSTISLAGTSNFRDVDIVTTDIGITIGDGSALAIGRTLSVDATNAAAFITVNASTLSVNAAGSPGGALVLNAGTGAGSIITTPTITLGSPASNTPVSVRSGETVTLVFDSAVAFASVLVGGNFDVSNTNGDISRADNGTFEIGGNLSLIAGSDDTNIVIAVNAGDQAAISGTVSLTTSGTGDATIINQTAIDFATTSIGRDLTAQAETGSIINTAGSIDSGRDMTLVALGAGGEVDIGQVNSVSIGRTLGVDSSGNATIFTNSALSLGTSDVTGNLTLQAASGSITSATGTAATIGGALSATTTTADEDITLTNLSLTGPASFSTTGSGGDVVVTNAIALNLGASTIGGVISALATTGGISQTGDLAISGLGASTFTANGTSNNIVLGNANLVSMLGGGGISLNTTGTGNATLSIDSAILAASTVGGNLVVTSLGGITQTGILTVAGSTELTAAADIDLSTSANLLTGEIRTITTAGANASINNGRATRLGLSNVDGNYTITSTGALTDDGIVTVAGNLALTTSTANANIVANQLAVTGDIAVTTTGGLSSATLVNATAISLAASTVTGALNATATTGGITQTGAIAAANGTFITSAADQAVVLTDAANAITGPISFTTTGTGGDVTLVNDAGTQLAASSIGGDLTVTTTTGSISRSGPGSLAVAGSASLATTAATATISHTGLAVAGPIRVNTGATGGAATITNATSVVLGVADMEVGGGLTVIATTGSITDDVAVLSGGPAIFTASSNAGNITLDNTSATSVAFNTATGGAGGNVVYTAATGNVVLGTSDVGRTLNVTATAGSISSATAAAIRVRGSGTGITGTDNVVLLTATGTGAGQGDINLSGLRVDSGRLTAAADNNLTLVSATPLNLSNIVAGAAAGAGDATTPGAINISASQIGLSGSMTTNRGNITLTGGPLRLLSATTTITSRYLGSAAAGAFNNSPLGTITINGNIDSGGTDNQRTLLLLTPNGPQYAGGLSSINMPIVRLNGQSIGSATRRLASLQINNDVVRANQPAVATVFASNTQGLSIFLGGDFLLGEGERWTSNGNFSLRANSATIGDFNTLGAATFNVPTVNVRRRAGSAVAFANPGELQIDLGTDLIFRGGLTASNPAGWTAIGTGEIPVIATSEGSLITSSGFRNVLLVPGYPSGADLFIGSQPADFTTGVTSSRVLTTAQGQTSTDVASSILRLFMLPDGTVSGAAGFDNGSVVLSVTDALNTLGIPLTAVRTGDDLVFERTTGRPSAGDVRSGFERFTNSGLQRALNTLEAIAVLPAESGQQMLAAAAAYAQLRDGGVVADPIGFAAWLPSQAEFVQADAALTRLAEHLRSLGELGLTPAETDAARMTAVSKLVPTAEEPLKRGFVRAAESRRLGQLASK